MCGVIVPGFDTTCPRSTSDFSVPRSSNPMLSPACPWSSSFLNISTPVTIRLIVGLYPTISISSCTFTIPRSTRPVTTVPRPEIVNTSSIGIRNGLSMSRTGSGTYLSSASISSRMHFASGESALVADPAFNAAPRTTGTSSPGNSYCDSSSRTSSSTRSKSSGSSTLSHLFRNTTMHGTPTCRASRMCSRVCGIGPSSADTTRIAPSICAAPVIMFFT